jgi:hypothetical protein
MSATSDGLAVKYAAVGWFHGLNDLDANRAQGAVVSMSAETAKPSATELISPDEQSLRSPLADPRAAAVSVTPKE